jgi:hypothetical protein
MLRPSPGQFVFGFPLFVSLAFIVTVHRLLNLLLRLAFLILRIVSTLAVEKLPVLRKLRMQIEASSSLRTDSKAPAPGLLFRSRAF